MIGFPELESCVYQDIIYDLKCPACNATLLPQQFIGVVFARCEAKISIADQSAVFTAVHDETVRYEFLYDGPEVRIRILERNLESDSDVVSTVYLSPTNGVNLIGQCSHQECVAFKDNRGVVIVRVGLIESGIFQDLVKYRNCPSCHHKMSQDSFQSVTFLGCQGEVEYEGRTDIFSAVSTPKNIKLDISGPKVVIRVKVDTHTPPNTTQTGVRESGHMAELSEKFGKLMCSEAEIPELEPGINFIAECPNNNACGIVAIPSGHTESCNYNQAIRGKSCPECKLPLPLNSFKGVAFFLCEARVTLGGKVSVCRAGRIAEVCELSAEGVEVDLEVVERDTGHETTEQLTKGRICHGLNVEAICINPKCSETIVAIPCPKVEECVFLDLIPTLKCPFCDTSIPIPFFIGFSLFRCEMEVKIGSEFKRVSAKEDETKYFRIEPNGPTVTIKVVGRNISKSGKLSKTPGQKYLRAGSGLNIVAECHNPECLARIENAGVINIKAPHIRSCLLSEAMVDLKCPSCDTIVTYHQVLAVTFVRCQGEIKFGEQTERFSLVGDEKKDFALVQNGPEVHINISKVRETFAKGFSYKLSESNV